MTDPAVEKYKVWPTQLDRDQFVAVVDAKTRDELVAMYPLSRRRYAREDDPRPRMVEAYLYFHDTLAHYFRDARDGELAQTPVAGRIEECFQALKNALQVVVIDLEQGDDAQVIFESLNGRGAALLPFDLVRNSIFRRASLQGDSPDELYQQYWRPHFDEPFWGESTQQGRLSRPRSDLFLQHFLAARLADDVPVRHLFTQYKQWVEKHSPYKTVQEELAALGRQSAQFRAMLAPAPGDPRHRLASLLARFDMSTAYPLLLHLAEAGLPEPEWPELGNVVESYVVRRTVCGMTTKNYNRVFLPLIRVLRDKGPSVAVVRAYLSQLPGTSTQWPGDAAFRAAWETRDVYHGMGTRLQHIFLRLSETYAGPKTEAIVLDGRLSVEHLMPQNWHEHWPLPEGAAEAERDADNPDESPAAARRESAVQTFGNLTLITQPLNAAVSNGPWVKKKADLLAASILPLNLSLQSYPSWDEESIAKRSEELFRRAVQLWPGPAAAPSPRAAP